MQLGAAAGSGAESTNIYIGVPEPPTSKKRRLAEVVVVAVDKIPERCKQATAH
jgi:hypothetical protein